MIRRYLTLRETAGALGKTPAWLYRNVKRLRREHGFPAADPAMGGIDAAAIAAWQDARLPAHLRPEAPDDAAAGWAAILDRNAEALGDAA